MRGAFNPVIQLLCAAGLNVLAPNVRGSTGYGTTYAQLDDRDLRWDSVRDGSAAAEFLTSSGIATTVGAEGVSYGGFMAVAVMIDSPSLWQAGVDIVGIADWETYFRSTPGWRRPLRAESYGDPDRPEDVAFLRRFSPLRRAKELQAPLLIVHDRHDPRVPVSEAELIASAAPGCELIVVEREGHCFVQGDNREAVFARVLDFLLDHLQ